MGANTNSHPCYHILHAVHHFCPHKPHANGNNDNGNGSSSSRRGESGPKATVTSAEKTNGHQCCADDPHSQQQSSPHDHPTSKWTWAGFLLLILVTKYTFPDQLRTPNPTLQHVWFYGWVTALSTGLGAAPLILAHDLGKAVLAYGNAIAAGMMLSASYSLVSEGATVAEPEGFTAGWWTAFAALLAAPWARVLLGVLAGLVFILSTKKVLYDASFVDIRCQVCFLIRVL